MARVAGIIVSGLLVGLAILFFMAAPVGHTGPRMIAGAVVLAIGGVVAWLSWRQRPEIVKRVEITQRIDLSGDIDLDELKCSRCGAELDRQSVVVKAGAVFIKCPFCGGDYQISEAPKW